jgi:hypothetical protein
MAYLFVCSYATPDEDEEDDDSITEEDVSSDAVEDMMAIVRMAYFCYQSYYDIDESECSNYDNILSTYRNKDIEIISRSKGQSPPKGYKTDQANNSRLRGRMQ